MARNDDLIGYSSKWLYVVSLLTGEWVYVDLVGEGENETMIMTLPDEMVTYGI